MNYIIKTTTCPSCNLALKTPMSLLRHFKYEHQGNGQDLFMKLNNITSIPLCACGCNENVEFRRGLGFRKYATQGCASRVNNCFGMGKPASIKCNETHKKMRAEGKMRPWIEGKTKENDARVAAMAERMIGQKRSKESREKMSKARIAYMKRTKKWTSFGTTHEVKLNGRDIVLKSNYELNALKYFQASNDIKYIDYEPVTLICESGAGYLPDFIITKEDDTKHIIEIKSEWYTTDVLFEEKVIAGLQYANANNMTYEVWTEKTHPWLQPKRHNNKYVFEDFDSNFAVCFPS